LSRAALLLKATLNATAGSRKAVVGALIAPIRELMDP
jgi:hypothetical protein